MVSDSKVSIKEAEGRMDKYYAKRQPVILHGPPGIGKTAVVKAFALRQGLPLIIVNAASHAPEDWGVLMPDKEKGVLRHFPPEWVVKCRDERHIVFFDELQQALPSTQCSVSPIVNEDRCGYTQLRSDTYYIAASNELGDRAAVNAMPTHVGNRFVHLHVQPDAESFIEHCHASGYWTMIAAFMKYNPSAVHRAPKDANDYAWPSPRTWEKLSIMVEGIEDDRIKLHESKELAADIIGAATAAEFNGFVNLSTQLDVAQMLEDPKKAVIPDKPDVQYSLVGAIHSHVQRKPKELVNPAVELMDKFGSNKDFAVLLLRALNSDPVIKPHLLKSKKADAAFEKYFSIYKRA